MEETKLIDSIKRTDVGKSTYRFEVSVDWNNISKFLDKAFSHLTDHLEIEGFRKGKVPKEIAKKHIKKDDIYRQALEEMLPRLYEELVKQESLKPIISPRVELESAKENEAWKVIITVAEKPNIKIEDYKKIITDLKAEKKKDEIWVPGKGEDKPDDKELEAKKNEYLNRVLEALLTKLTIEVPELIVENELNRRLTQLVDDVRAIGLSIEAYLKSKNETLESVKERYKKEITDMYALEFVLEEIANDAQIKVEQEDLEKLMASITDEKAKKEASQNAYFYASLLKRQKTLDYLMNL